MRPQARPPYPTGADGSTPTLPLTSCVLSMTKTATQIPADLKPADGRFGCGPSKVRPEALARLAAAADLMGTSHRQAPVRDLVARMRGGLGGAVLRCPPATRWCSATAAPRPSGTRRAAWLVRERPLHLTYGEFSSKFAKVDGGRAVPGGPDPGRGGAGRRPEPGRGPGRGRDRLGAQRDLDRGDGRRLPRPSAIRRARWS